MRGESKPRLGVDPKPGTEPKSFLQHLKQSTTNLHLSWCWLLEWSNSVAHAGCLSRKGNPNLAAPKHLKKGKPACRVEHGYFFTCGIRLLFPLNTIQKLFPPNTPPVCCNCPALTIPGWRGIRSPIPHLRKPSSAWPLFEAHAPVRENPKKSNPFRRCMSSAVPFGFRTNLKQVPKDALPRSLHVPNQRRSWCFFQAFTSRMIAMAALVDGSLVPSVRCTR